MKYVEDLAGRTNEENKNLWTNPFLGLNGEQNVLSQDQLPDSWSEEIQAPGLYNVKKFNNAILC